MRARRPSPAMVISLIALFVALSGVAWAASSLTKNSVKSKHIKNGQVKGKDVADDGLTGADIVESSLEGISGSAGPPGPPGPSTGPAGGDLAGSYPNPSVAANAIGSPEVANNSLGGADVDESSLALGSEPWHEIGAPGEPNFFTESDASCQFNNFDPSAYNSAAFTRDRSGFVHLKGLVDADGPACNFDGDAEDRYIFVLPPGYLPERLTINPVIAGNALGRVDIHPIGIVFVETPTTNTTMQNFVQLDGISFRCFPSGASGCP